MTMTSTRPRMAARFVAGLSLVAGVGAAARAQTPSPSPAPAQKGAAMSGRAAGAFDVKMTPGPEDKESGVGRAAVDKQYHGDLEGTAKAEMLSWLSPVQGSAVYVAIERVNGTLRGRTGTFVLHHRGVMTRGAPDLSIAVVPDSGTGQLTGIAGKMQIIIAGGKHSYDFEYTLPETP
jgi:Protein of unknown function (DUF3224)